VFLRPPAIRRDPDSMPLLRFRSPSGYLPEGPRPTPCDAGTSHGIPCRSTYQFRGSPPLPGPPKPRVKFRVQGFSPPSRFAPPSAVRVYFAPQTSFGCTLQGVSLPESRTSSSHVLCRLAVAPRLRTRRLDRRDQRRTQPPSLETGLVPLAGFTALLPPGVRTSGQWV